MKEARFYEKLNNNRVKCHLCAHHCVITKNRRGICGVRENRSGSLYSLVYATLIAENIDPIEKSRSFISCLDLNLFLSQQLAVIFDACIARITIFLRCLETEISL
jgi:hypothetical protein